MQYWNIWQGQFDCFLWVPNQLLLEVVQDNPIPSQVAGTYVSTWVSNATNMFVPCFFFPFLASWSLKAAVTWLDRRWLVGNEMRIKRTAKLNLITYPTNLPLSYPTELLTTVNFFSFSSSSSLTLSSRSWKNHKMTTCVFLAKKNHITRTNTEANSEGANFLSLFSRFALLP